MADRAAETNNDAACDAKPSKKPYAAPVVVHWGTFRDVTQSNNHTQSKDSKRSQGTN